MTTILVVDDKASLRTMVESYLTQEGYRVVTAGDGRAALFVARQEKPDLILLDVMMPEMDGFGFIQVHKQERDTPVILLTARLEEVDKVVGLELGADDYITKPFSMRELVARIRAVLRRVEKQSAPADILEVDGLRLDRNSRLVWTDGAAVTLTPSEFDILALLLESPGHVYSRESILDQLQGVFVASTERSVDVHIRNLRRKIEPDPANPRYVETVFGVGYRMRG